MKKILKIIILMTMILMLCGCGEKAIIEENVTDTNIAVNSGEEKNDVTKKINNNEKIYKTTNEEVVPDIVIGDNFFATQVADIMLNFNNYEGKIIEVEGFSLTSPYGYNFVGRYSINVICPDCPTGYTYLEYEWHGEEVLDFGTEETWIKVKGELKKGFDGMEYYYIDAYEIEEMDEWGIATVEN